MEVDDFDSDSEDEELETPPGISAHENRRYFSFKSVDPRRKKPSVLKLYIQLDQIDDDAAYTVRLDDSTHLKISYPWQRDIHTLSSEIFEDNDNFELIQIRDQLYLMRVGVKLRMRQFLK